GNIAWPRCSSQHESVLWEHAQAEHVDKRVVGIAVVEDDFAADGWDSDGIPVARYSADHAGGDPATPRVAEWPEAQRIHDSDWPGPHSEDVAKYSTDPRGGTLVWLDG